MEYDNDGCSAARCTQHRDSEANGSNRYERGRIGEQNVEGMAWWMGHTERRTGRKLEGTVAEQVRAVDNAARFSRARGTSRTAADPPPSSEPAPEAAAAVAEYSE